MKKLFLLPILLLFFSNLSFSQEDTTTLSSYPQVKRTALSVGFMMGGGSLVGADIEYVFKNSNIGIQAGAGFTSFGFGLNYHFKQYANSPFVSLQCWNQQFGKYATWVGPMYVYRLKKILQVGVGFAGALYKGDLWYENNPNPDVNVNLIFQLGIYL